MKPLFAIAALLWFGVNSAHAGWDNAVETYTMEASVDGEKVVQMVQVFSEDLLQHPEMLSEIRKLPLDHIAYFDEEAPGAQRDPSQTDDPRLLQEKLVETGIPVEKVRARAGFLKRMRELWKESFPKLNKKDPEVRSVRRASRQFAIVSTIGKLGTLAFMIVTNSKKYTIYDWLPMAVAQGFGAYVANRWPKNISHFLEQSWHTANQKASGTIFFLRRLAWTFVMTEFYKIGEVKLAAFTPQALTEVAMSTLLYGVGDGLLSNILFKKYSLGLPEEEARHRINLMNFWLGSVSGILAGLDQMKHHWMPALFPIGSYDFRLSGVLLLGYYGFFIYHLMKNPESTYRGVAAVNQFFVKLVDGATRPIVRWFKGAISDCDSVFQGVPPRSDGPEPPNDALPD